MCKAGITQDLQNVENIRITECGDFDSRDYESRDYESHPSSLTDEKLDELAGKQCCDWSFVTRNFDQKFLAQCWSCIALIPPLD